MIKLCIFAAFIFGGHVLAKNIDLSTVPKRDTVQLTIYNSEDLTLVRETRQLSFKKGSNPLQFSWANTLIDASSVELNFLTAKDRLDVVDTTYPHDKPQLLYWNVASEEDITATVEISYFTSGITWSSDYQAVALQSEKSMQLKGFVRVTNHSGEDYDNAQVRLVVGSVNLVEKIAQLGRTSMANVAQMKPTKRNEYKRRAAREMFAAADRLLDESESVMPSSPSSPKKIVKQGLSEYFIYTIEGTESIKNGWSKRLKSFYAAEVPIEVKYRYRPQEYGQKLVRLYLLKNDKASMLGETPLPGGSVRIFRQNERDGLMFMAKQQLRYIPVGEKIELNLGVDPDVIFAKEIISSRRDNIWLRSNKGSHYRHVGSHEVRYDWKGQVAGWDEHDVLRFRVKNYSKKPIEIEVRQQYSGDVVFTSPFAVKNYDYRTVQFSGKLEAGAKHDFNVELTRKKSYNHKQNHVVVKRGKVVAKPYRLM